MSGQFMEPEDALRLLNMAGQDYRPRQIRELKRRIRTAKVEAEQKYTATGEIDMNQVHDIVAMMRELDNLYALWAEGKLGDTN